MKRIFSLLTLLFCLFPSCIPTLAETMPGYVGTWIETEGYGTLTVRLDGSATMIYYDGTVMDTTWHATETGAAFGDGMWYNSPMELLDDNTLSVSGGWMIFAREGFMPTADSALLLNATPVGEEGAPFLGTWNLVSITLEGEALDPALFGMTMTLTFNEDGTVVSDDGWEPYTTTWFASYGSAIIEGDVLTIGEEGQLVYNAADGQMLFDRVIAEEPAATLPAAAAPVTGGSAELTGVWTLLSIEMDGVTLDPALFGMSMTLTLSEDGTAAIDDGEDVSIGAWYIAGDVLYVEDMPLTLDESGCLVLEEDGAKMRFSQGEVIPGEAPSEEEQWLALMGLMGAASGEGDDWGNDDWGEWDVPADLPEAQQPYVGEWYMVYCHTGGLSGDLRTMGVNGCLMLDADGTGYLIGVADEFGVWYEEDGVIRFGESGMPMYLLGDEADGMGPFLQYGTEAGGYMLFHQDEEAVWTPGLYPLQGAASAALSVPAASAPADSPAATGGTLLMDTRYVCRSYTTAGFTMDAATLGAEYAVTFYAGGTVDFTLAGFTMGGLPYSVADGQYVIDYYGNPFACIPTDAGFDMDYYGAMMMHFTPAE